jgi:hypothetical protein
VGFGSLRDYELNNVEEMDDHLLEHLLWVQRCRITLSRRSTRYVAHFHDYVDIAQCTEGYRLGL